MTTHPPPDPTPPAPTVPRPATRRIKIYAFDPSTALDNRTAGFAVATIQIPWEEKDVDKPLSQGPANEYFEVVDVDPASGKVYPPVDLDNPWLLATDGHAPSESNPQFHQQMAFAVAMKTVETFETALGRRILWAPRRFVDDADVRQFEMTPRLRIYPHALRDENAFYSPDKMALLFGYYQTATESDDEVFPGGWIFGCLSHDIVAHETTHAVLDGLNRYYIEDSNIDALAFHEAFADIVALLQHFTFPEAVAGAIAQSPTLDVPTLLSGMARQFGRASNHNAADLPPGPLRDAMTGGPQSNGAQPDRSIATLAGYTECHARGFVLVSAVYDAFVHLYSGLAHELLALTTGRTAFDPGAALHPAVVQRLTNDAVRTARRLLKTCIRGLDYLPPTSVTFGDFLRAVVTVDRSLFPVDDLGFRRALIASFRRYGIFPAGVRSLAEDSLVWREHVELTCPPLKWGAGTGSIDIEPVTSRRDIFEQERANNRVLHAWLVRLLEEPSEYQEFVKRTGLAHGAAAPPSVKRRDRDNTGAVAVEIHACRLSRLTGDHNKTQRQLIVQVCQSRFGYASAEQQATVDRGGSTPPPPHDFSLRGGCTLVFDLMRLTRRAGQAITSPRYVIAQPVAGPAGEIRLGRLRDHLFGSDSAGAGAAAAYQAPGRRNAEPFAALHRS